MKTEDSGSKNEPPGEKDSEKTKGPDIDGQIVTIQPHDVQRNQRQPAECLSLLIETAKVSVPHSDTSRSSHGSTYCPEKSERAVGYNLLEKTVARRIFSAEDDEYTRFCCLKGTVICIEGIISAGKTTLGNMMKKYLSDLGFNVEFLEETVNEKMLTLFYNDPKKYAFALQVHLATFCQANLAKAHHKSNQNGTICIVDRCLWGNAVFAAMHASSENMSMTEWEAYMSILSKGKYYTCGHVVYLDCDPEKCLERVLKRARKSEKPIDISYLKALERYYTTEMLLHVKYETANVVILPWNDYGDVKYVLDQIVQHRPYSISENEDMLQIFNASREQRSDFIQKLLQQRIQK